MKAHLSVCLSRLAVQEISKAPRRAGLAIHLSRLGLPNISGEHRQAHSRLHMWSWMEACQA